MTTDPKMQGAPILRDTACRVGTHAFLWASDSFRRSEPPGNVICTCGKYTWEEWTLLNKPVPTTGL